MNILYKFQQKLTLFEKIFLLLTKDSSAEATKNKKTNFIGTLYFTSLGIYPVSYTHLDVYKRQPHANVTVAELRKSILESGFDTPAQLT